MLRVLAKERRIDWLYADRDALSMKQYLAGSSMARADRRDIRKYQKLDEKIAELEKEKNELLDTKEVVAAYELHKIAGYAQALQDGKLVQTPSVQAQKRDLRSKILAGKTLLLS